MENRMEGQDRNDALLRLNSILDQVTGVKKMIEENKDIPYVIIQLQAVASATKVLETILLQTHLETYIE